MAAVYHGRRTAAGSIARVIVPRTSPVPVLSFDLGSPYAYLACARAATVLGGAPVLEPVLLGVMFARRGHGSWAHTAARAREMAEVERRASAYGLPALAWPPGWPADGLAAMRAATWAAMQGRLEPFVAAAFTAAFARGEALADLDVLRTCAAQAGLDAGALAGAIATDAVKLALRERTETAWQAGVRGVPTLRRGTALFYGDDQLERARDAFAAGGAP